jgi:hypothetical protein
MWAEGVPDNEITIEHEWVAGPVVVQEGLFSGTHTGTLMTPDGQAIPPPGRSIKAAYADVFEVEGDRITAERLYFDQVELLTQGGRMGAAARAAPQRRPHRRGGRGRAAGVRDSSRIGWSTTNTSSAAGRSPARPTDPPASPYPAVACAR